MFGSSHVNTPTCDEALWQVARTRATVFTDFPVVIVWWPQAKPEDVNACTTFSDTQTEVC